MANEGISGIAVAVAAFGGVLVYAGFQGLNPLEALREITSGKAKPLADSDVSWIHDAMSNGLIQDPNLGGAVGGGIAQAGYSPGSSAVGNALVQAAMKHKNEKYSQAKRWQAGYSDCSSFVGKAFKDIGIAPPGASVTGSYLAWNKLKTVSKSSIQAGDLLCGAGHIAIAISSTQAIGQQNTRRNVQVGSISSIMTGGSWNPRRYVGQRAVSA